MTFLDCDEVDMGSAHKHMDAIDAIFQLSYSPAYSKTIIIKMKGYQYLIPLYITPLGLRRIERA